MKSFRSRKILSGEGAGLLNGAISGHGLCSCQPFERLKDLTWATELAGSEMGVGQRL